FGCCRARSRGSFGHDHRPRIRSALILAFKLMEGRVKSPTGGDGFEIFFRPAGGRGCGRPKICSLEQDGAATVSPLPAANRPRGPCPSLSAVSPLNYFVRNIPLPRLGVPASGLAKRSSRRKSERLTAAHFENRCLDALSFWSNRAS